MEHPCVGINQLLYLGTEVSISVVDIKARTCGDGHVTSSILYVSTHCLQQSLCTVHLHVALTKQLLPSASEPV